MQNPIKIRRSHINHQSPHKSSDLANNALEYLRHNNTRISLEEPVTVMKLTWCIVGVHITHNNSGALRTSLVDIPRSWPDPRAGANDQT